ncbi:MAG: glycoside hydrolase family 3 N-terminal domain-containing protein [Pirellulaceae bacterium]|nr:hypothetical protein [Planctomycetales bacterium]
MTRVLRAKDEEELRRQVGQLMFPRIGSNLPPVRTVDEDAAAIEKLLIDCPIGGLCLFNGKGADTRGSLKRLQQISEHPLLVATDMERGAGQQIAGATLFPHAMAFSAIGEEAEERVALFARVAAREALSSGVQIAFAPVADVNSNPANPIIATRAFASEPNLAARLVASYIRGAHEEGLLVTAKHFPGHGDTELDSHDELPMVLHDETSLWHQELVPFQAAIDAQVDLVMTSHVSYRAWDDDGRPATLSANILRGLLRKRLRFVGAVVSDSLLMAGVRACANSEGDLAVRALQSGVDILLDVQRPSEVVRHVVQAVDEGRLDADDIALSCQRVVDLREKMLNRFGEAVFYAPDEIEWNDAVLPDGNVLARQVAREAITVMTREGESPRLSRDANLAVMMLKPNQSRWDPPEQPLAECLRWFWPELRYGEWGPESPDSDVKRWTEMAEQTDQLLVAMIVKPAAWHRFGLLSQQRQWLVQMARRRRLLLVSLGVPAALNGLGGESGNAIDGEITRLCTYSDVPVSQEMFARFLAGEFVS